MIRNCSSSAAGKIVEAYVEDFAALSKDGKLIVNIHNTGQVSADFPVGYRQGQTAREDCSDVVCCRMYGQVAVDKCSPGIADVPAKTKTVDANQVERYVFNVWHHISLATNNTCTGTLARTPTEARV